MKFTTAALTLLSAGAVLATAAAPNSDNNIIKRHDRAPGFDEAHIPDGARGPVIQEHVIKEKRHDRAPGFDEAHIPANARGGNDHSGLKRDHVMKKEAPLI